MIFTKSMGNKIFLVGKTDKNDHGNTTVLRRNSLHTNDISCLPRQDASVPFNPLVTQFFFYDHEPKIMRKKSTVVTEFPAKWLSSGRCDWLSPT